MNAVPRVYWGPVRMSVYIFPHKYVRATSWNLLHSCIMEADANPSQKSEQNYWQAVLAGWILLPLLWVLELGESRVRRAKDIGRWLSIESSGRVGLMFCRLLFLLLQVQPPLSATWCHRDTQKRIHWKGNWRGGVGPRDEVTRGRRRFVIY